LLVDIVEINNAIMKNLYLLTSFALVLLSLGSCKKHNNTGSPVQMNDIAITGNTSTPGIYNSASGIQIIGNGLATSLGSALNMFAITYNLTNVGGVGQYIDVSFSGTYQEMVMSGMNQGYNLSHTISGTAHVIRDN
jgi:hypothetical protein